MAIFHGGCLGNPTTLRRPACLTGWAGTATPLQPGSTPPTAEADVVDDLAGPVGGPAPPPESGTRYTLPGLDWSRPMRSPAEGLRYLRRLRSKMQRAKSSTGATTGRGEELEVAQPQPPLPLRSTALPDGSRGDGSACFVERVIGQLSGPGLASCELSAFEELRCRAAEGVVELTGRGLGELHGLRPLRQARLQPSSPFEFPFALTCVRAAPGRVDSSVPVQLHGLRQRSQARLQPSSPFPFPFPGLNRVHR